MTPTWAELHAMEPGLRPPCVNAGDLGEGVWPSCPLCHYDGLWDVRKSGEKFARLLSDGNDAALALSRDRAVEWLSQQRSIHVNCVGGQRGVVSVHADGPAPLPLQDTRFDNEWYWRFAYPTRDEALRAACAAVIASK